MILFEGYSVAIWGSNSRLTKLPLDVCLGKKNVGRSSAIDVKGGSWRYS